MPVPFLAHCICDSLRFYFYPLGFQDKRITLGNQLANTASFRAFLELPAADFAIFKPPLYLVAGLQSRSLGHIWRDRCLLLIPNCRCAHKLNSYSWTAKSSPFTRPSTPEAPSIKRQALSEPPEKADSTRLATDSRGPSGRSNSVPLGG